MPASTSVIAAKDGAGSTITGGLVAQDKSGAGTGPFFAAHAMVDAQGVNIGTIKAASTAVVAGDTAIAVGLHPTSPLPAGTNVIGHVIVDTAPTTAVTIATAPVLVAGAAIIGKVGIDQTTDGTTNAVHLTAGTNIVGKFTTDQTTHGTTDKVAADLYVGGAATDKGSGTGGTATQRIIVDTSQIGTQQTTAQPMATGYTLVGIPIDQVWPKGMSPKGFAAAFTTLTRVANTTAYVAGNSISNNVTAGSVTALTATVSDTNNDPVTLTDILLFTTDTGAAGKRIRAYVYNSDPTASTGVKAGDGAAFSNNHAGYIGSFSGVLETGFADGAVGRLVPSFNDSATAPVPNAPAGGLVVTTPVSGAKTLFIQFQAIDAFTPVSASTWIATARGFQGRVG